jgi:hypothetical protein
MENKPCMRLVRQHEASPGRLQWEPHQQLGHPRRFLVPLTADSSHKSLVLLTVLGNHFVKHRHD